MRTGSAEWLRREWPLIGYSAGNFGKNLLLSGVDVTLLFLLTDLLGIAPASISALMLVIFVGDLMFDIGSGYLASFGSARGFGYCRIIAVGAFPCGLAFALLYSLPLLELRSLTVLGITLLIFRAAYAVIDVPHNSLLTRVAPDSRARGRTSGYRLFFSSLASLAIAIVLTPSVVQAARLSMTGNLALLGWSGAGLFCLALWIAAWSSGTSGPGRVRDPSPTRIMLFPRPDRLLGAMIVIAMATGFAMPMFGRMVLYLATYVLGQPAFASRILLAMTLGQFPGVLLWTYLVRLAEKTTLLTASHVTASLGILLFALAGPRQELLIGAAVIIGVGLAGVFMLPWGLLADIVDFAELKHGERRETATFASILVILKAGAAASVGSISLVLGALGYTARAHQGPAVQLAMQALAFGVPLAGSVASIWVLRYLAIGHQRHARVVRALAARRQRQGSSGSIGSTRREEAEGRNVNSVADSRAPIVPG